MSIVQRIDSSNAFKEKFRMSKGGYKGKVIDGIGEFLSELYKDLKKDVFSKIPHVKTRLMKEFKLAQKRVFNEKVAIIGPPAVGKTSFLKILRSPHIERSELQTYEKTESVPFDGFKVAWNVPVADDCQIDFAFKVAAGIDNGGEDYIREGRWLETVSKSGIIFYLFDFEKFRNPQERERTIARILKDFEWIAENVNAFQSNFTIVLLGNKADLFCASLREFRILSEEMKPEFEALYAAIQEGMPKGFSNNVKMPRLISLFDKKIRNEQFGELMLAVMGKNLVEIIRECHEMESQES
jgi:GTPase SAR1 family protein